MNPRIVVFVTAVLILLSAAPLFADVVHLNDGRKLKGKIVSETEDLVVLEGKYGKVEIRRDEIDHIERGPIEEEQEEEEKEPKQPPEPPEPREPKKPKPRRSSKDDLWTLADEAAKGDSRAAKKLIAARRAALPPIAKKLETAQGEEKERLEKLFEEIEQATGAEKAEASRLFEKGMKLHKQAVALNEEAGGNPTAEQQAKALKLVDEMAEKLVEAFELDPTRNDIMETVARTATLYYKAQRYGRAIPMLESLQRHVPGNKDVLQMLASSYMNLKKFREARKMLESILEKDSENATAWANLGVADLSESKFDKAIDEFEKAISLGMDNAAIRHNLGVAYKHKSKWDKAAENFKKAFEMDQKNAQALFELGAAYANMQQYTEAVEAWEKLCELFPDSSQAKAAKPQIKKLKKKIKK